jgi:hypothetical protein
MITQFAGETTLPRRESQVSLWSSTLAVMAWVLITSMPFSALTFDS